MTENHEQIIEGLRQKDKRTIAHLYDNYSAALYGLLLRMVKDEMVAQDLLQETFVKIWRYADRYDPKKGTLFTWTASIARNLALNKVQSKSYRKQQHVESLSLNSKNYPILPADNVNKIGLKGLVAQLDDKYSIIIELAYFKGYTQKEIEEKLNIPLGTVKSRLKIALRELRALFDYEQKFFTTLLWILLYHIV